MHIIIAYIHVNEPASENWQLISEHTFQSADCNWMLQGLVPNEKDIIPWQETVLPSGEFLQLGAVFTDPTASLAIYVRDNSQSILELQTKGYPCIRFMSPRGTGVSVQIHEKD